jgi:hypothetical protein
VHPLRRRTDAATAQLPTVGRALAELIGNSTAASSLIVTVLAEELIAQGILDREMFLARVAAELDRTPVYGQSMVRAALTRLTRDLSPKKPSKN